MFKYYKNNYTKRIGGNMSKPLEKLEKVVEDLYYDKRIVSFTEKKLSEDTTEYTFVAKLYNNPPRLESTPVEKVEPTKKKVILKKELKKDVGPVKPPKPPMADIVSVGGY